MGACNLPHTLIHVVLSHAEAGLILLTDDDEVTVPAATLAGIGNVWAAYEATARFLLAEGWLVRAFIRLPAGFPLEPSIDGLRVLERKAPVPDVAVTR